MHFYTTLTLISAVFIISTSASAFPLAFPATDNTCLNSCTALYTVLKQCGYDLFSGITPTSAEMRCICQSNNVGTAYKACTSCEIQNGYMTEADYKKYTAEIEAGCNSVDGSSSSIGGSGNVRVSGAKALVPLGGQVFAGAVVAGFGYYGL